MSMLLLTPSRVQQGMEMVQGEATDRVLGCEFRPHASLGMRLSAADLFSVSWPPTARSLGTPEIPPGCLSVTQTESRASLNLH